MTSDDVDNISLTNRLHSALTTLTTTRFTLSPCAVGRVRPLATTAVALLHLTRSLASRLRLLIEEPFQLIVSMYSTKRRTMGLLEL